MTSDLKAELHRIKVFFANQETPKPPIKAECIVVYPTDRGWNDFRLHSRFDFIFHPKDGTPFIGKMKLAFLPDGTDPHEVVSSKIGKGDVLESKSLPTFFSLLLDIEEYRKIMATLHASIALRVLRSLHDIGLAAIDPKPEEWLEQALASNAFNTSLTRTPQSYFAFLNGRHIVYGRDFSTNLTPPNEFTVKFRLAPFSNDHLIKFNFLVNGPTTSRICAMIGENGLGKSYALTRITQSFLGGLTDDHVLGSNEKRIAFSHLLAVATPGETDRTFPASPRRSRALYLRLTTGRRQASRKKSGTTALILQILRLDQEIGGVRRRDLFVESVTSALDLTTIGLPTKHSARESDGVYFLPLKSFLKGGEEAFLDQFGMVDQTRDPCFIADDRHFPLSSGQNAFLSLAAQLSLHINNGSLVLLDEPETHLHPSLIACLIRMLEKILELVNGRAIVATHSPYLVRELPRSQVLIFKRDEKSEIRIGPAAMRTIGADIGSISFFVFGDQMFGQLLEKARADMKKIVPSERSEYIAKLEGEYSPEALMYLRSQLPSWNQ